MSLDAACLRRPVGRELLVTLLSLGILATFWVAWTRVHGAGGAVHGQRGASHQMPAGLQDGPSHGPLPDPSQPASRVGRDPGMPAGASTQADSDPAMGSVTVVLFLPCAMPKQSAPFAELLEIGAEGTARRIPHPVVQPRGPGAGKGIRIAGDTGSDAAPSRSGSQDPAADDTVWAVSLEYPVRTAGHYAPAWHCWVQVPGTETWRVVRGRGQPVWLAPDGSERRLELWIREESLVLPTGLDARSPGAVYHFTPKDG